MLGGGSPSRLERLEDKSTFSGSKGLDTGNGMPPDPLSKRVLSHEPGSIQARDGILGLAKGVNAQSARSSSSFFKSRKFFGSAHSTPIQYP